jgi:hypothetical protein
MASLICSLFIYPEYVAFLLICVAPMDNLSRKLNINSVHTDPAGPSLR